MCSVDGLPSFLPSMATDTVSGLLPLSHACIVAIGRASRCSKTSRARSPVDQPCNRIVRTAVLGHSHCIPGSLDSPRPARHPTGAKAHEGRTQSEFTITRIQRRIKQHHADSYRPQSLCLLCVCSVHALRPVRQPFAALGNRFPSTLFLGHSTSDEDWNRRASVADPSPPWASCGASPRRRTLASTRIATAMDTRATTRPDCRWSASLRPPPTDRCSGSRTNRQCGCRTQRTGNACCARWRSDGSKDDIVSGRAHSRDRAAAASGWDPFVDLIRSLRPLCVRICRVCRLSSMRQLSVSRMQSASRISSRLHGATARLLWMHGRTHHGRAERGSQPTTKCRSGRAITAGIERVQTICEHFRRLQPPEQPASEPGGDTAAAVTTAAAGSAAASIASIHRRPRSRSRHRFNHRVARRVVVQCEGHRQQRIYRSHYDERGLCRAAAAAHRPQQQARVAIRVSRRGPAAFLHASFESVAERWWRGHIHGVDHC